jgi:Fe-S cluster biogenesis protein NfuA
MEIEEKIKKALDKIRSVMQAHGGDVEFKSWDKKAGIVKVHLTGMCADCPMAKITLKQGIEAEVKKEVPEVKEVVAV